jgi:MOSC domain-containing protein YiiM
MLLSSTLSSRAVMLRSPPERSKDPPVVISVNVGQPRPFELNGRSYTSAIWKSPVEGRRRLTGINVAGDDQADLTVHGGHDKAVYAYAQEDYSWWEGRLGYVPEPGTFGENLTVLGIDVNKRLVGERWRVGTALLEVTQPRLPCFKLGVRMDDPTFPRRFSSAARWGSYLAIVEEGDVGAGDVIEVVDRPAHEVTVGLVAYVYYHDHTRAHELLDADSLPHGWRTWAENASR